MSAPSSHSLAAVPAPAAVLPAGARPRDEADIVLAQLEELNKLLVAEDNENMDSGWHYFELHLLVEVIHQHLRGRNDYYAGANNFIYFSAAHARNRDFRGPDFFFVDHVPREPIRPFWCVWEENGRYPDLIIELLSSTTAAEDRGVKKNTYEQVFHTSELFLYDPDLQQLEGWRLGASMTYEPIPANERGWMWSERVGAWLGTWRGSYQSHEAVWLRWFDSRGTPVPTGDELAAAEALQAEAEKARAQAATERATAEKQRADTLAAEVARLQALLQAQQHDQPGA